jgi:hypothetical protein
LTSSTTTCSRKTMGTRATISLG